MNNDDFWQLAYLIAMFKSGSSTLAKAEADNALAHLKEHKICQTQTS